MLRRLATASSCPHLTRAFSFSQASDKVNFKEYVLPKPIGEIKDFVKALPTN